ncbi:hypothetical protein GTA08_BOTSDO01852 [Botryosphaeria dothidea]|uniref:Transcription factor cmr1 protein n=1 Tax=Botryosphaeria dothidea TaxID=55169 RepID=A0A8H4IYN5_9PEZI|nr:hypothetical protein GTA08_BOTSDO01852 [Botryosphaeria dothidea]
MRVLNLIDDAAGPVNARELSSLFDALDAVEPADLVGDWSGGDFHDNENGQNGSAVVPERAVERAVHPCHAMLESYRWAGVVVESLENAMPVMTWTDEGKRVESEYWGRAQIRSIKFRDVVSACCIFDRWPIIFHFRRVSDNTLMGFTDAKDKAMRDAGEYYFWLRK